MYINTHTHTRTRVCVCVCVCVRAHTYTQEHHNTTKPFCSTYVSSHLHVYTSMHTSVYNNSFKNFMKCSKHSKPEDNSYSTQPHNWPGITGSFHPTQRSPQQPGFTTQFHILHDEDHMHNTTMLIYPVYMPY